MTSFQPACLPTALGSLPLVDPLEACQLMTEFFPAIPVWPQLPKRTYLENMYVQFSEGLPGIVVTDKHCYVDTFNTEPGLEAIYTAYLSEDVDAGSISAYYAPGLACFMEMKNDLAGCIVVKGQITGPISLGLQITDQDRRPILYDEVLADALAKHLQLKARWQEQALRTLCDRTLLFLDEPYLASIGSAYVALREEQVLTCLAEVLEGIRGLKGLHCCGNTDWALLLSLPLDVVSFDAYTYAMPFSLYSDSLAAFVRRGGVIAWGIVPNTAEALAAETTASLVGRLIAAMDLLVDKGIPRDDLLHQSLVTPACGLGTLSPEAARAACAQTAAVSAHMRSRFGLR
jgi:hypothetical protein